MSDNGASAEGGPNGSFNENKFFNNVPDTIEDNLKHLDELGTPSSYNHYCSGWAWAFDTPFPYWKRYAGYEGGTADMCIISWPKGIAARGEVRDQYVHAVDVVPTLYDLIGVEPPAEIGGAVQSPVEGESFAVSLVDPARAGQGDAVLLDARPARPCTTAAGSPTRCTRRSPAGATSTPTSGSSTTWPRTARRRATWPPSTRTRSRS